MNIRHTRGSTSATKNASEGHLDQFDLVRSKPLIAIRLSPKSVPYSILLLDNLHWQSSTDAKQDKGSPLPPEWVDSNHEDEPVNQLAVSEEVKCAAADIISMGFDVIDRGRTQVLLT